MNYVTMSPCYEILRYGHDKIKNQVVDAHTMWKQAKFIIGVQDLIDPSKPPVRDNFRFEACQIDGPDILIYVDKNGNSLVLKGEK